VAKEIPFLGTLIKKPEDLEVALGGGRSRGLWRG
jgi:hypothetical protein